MQKYSYNHILILILSLSLSLTHTYIYFFAFPTPCRSHQRLFFRPAENINCPKLVHRSSNYLPLQSTFMLAAFGADSFGHVLAFETNWSGMQENQGAKVEWGGSVYIFRVWVCACVGVRVGAWVRLYVYMSIWMNVYMWGRETKKSQQLFQHERGFKN